MPDNSLEFVCTHGIEAFNRIFELLIFSPSNLLTFRPSLFNLPPQKLLIKAEQRQNQLPSQIPPQAFICPKGAIPSFQYSIIPSFPL